MAPRPLVSVVMAVLEPHPTYFPAAVQSVLQQSYEELELVIVEDPSRQSAAELLRSFSDSRICHHCNKTRTSHVAQRNLCLSRARGDLVAVLDADDLCDVQRIQKQVEFLRRHDDVSVLGSQLEIIDASGSHLGWRRYPLDHAAIHDAMRRHNPIAHPSAMFRRPLVLDAGGYRYERYPANEDYELWCRLAHCGARFANYPEPLLQYRLHRGGMKATRLRGIIRGTLDVKTLHWSDEMDWPARMRMHLERALLLLPSSLVYRLFVWMQYQKEKP